MAVTIENMAMPKRCLDCQLMGREKMYCQLHPRRDLNVNRVVSEKPDWCPLKGVPTGHWYKRTDNEVGYGEYMCSNCNNILGSEYMYKYCPDCGALMQGENICE